MKKTSNFKALFQKIHKDNLLRSRFNSQVHKQLPSRAVIDTSKSININLHLSSTNSKQNKIDGIKQTQRKKSNRPPSAYVPIPLHKQQASQSVKSFTQILTKLYKQIVKQLKTKTRAEVDSIKKQFSTILQLCHQMKQNSRCMEQKLVQFQQELSKLLQHRISRVFFYFIYFKFLEGHSCTNKVQKQLKILSLCEQYSRNLGLYSLTLHACLRISKLLCSKKNFQQGKQYTKKAIRLAVYLNNQSQQFKGIQTLKFVDFYTGLVKNDKQNYLSNQDKQIILKNFNPHTDLTKIRGNQQDSINFLSSIVYNIQRYGEQQDLKMSQNIQNFISNLTLMNKDLTDRSKNIIGTIKKVNTVGTVKKYMDGGNCIILQPRSRNIPNKNRGQVLLTHFRKKSEFQATKKFDKFYLPKIIQMINNLAAINIDG